MLKGINIFTEDGFITFEQHFQEVGLEFVFVEKEHPAVLTICIEMVKDVHFCYSLHWMHDDGILLRVTHNYCDVVWPHEDTDGMSSYRWSRNPEIEQPVNYNDVSVETFVEFLEKITKERSVKC